MTEPPVRRRGRMRRQVAVLVTSIALVALAIAPRAAAPIERPRYSRGDFWSYATNLTEAFGLRFEGNTTITAGDVVPITVQGEAYDALEASLAGGGTFAGDFPGFGTVAGMWTVTGVDDWETTAWNGVRSFLRLTAEGVLTGGPTPLSFILEFVNTTTRRVTSDTFGWPIHEGTSGDTAAHWNVSLNATFQAQGFPPSWNQTWIDADFVTAYAHNGTERITVPAGTFDAHRIREAGPEGGHRERWYAPRVGADVRQWDYNETGDRLASTELTVFRYAAGVPPPGFPWMYGVLAALAATAIALAALAWRKRRRKPVEVWMPPDAGSP